jgi:hypothetical protein
MNWRKWKMNYVEFGSRIITWKLALFVWNCC